MGIQLDGPTNLVCDNISVVLNNITPESTLTKRHNSIAYHHCREAQAAKIVQVTKEGTKTNLVDILTKLLNGPRLRELAGKLLW